ncbi:NUDIX hydrolase [Pseudorhodoplanes sp.]|uniref:NUDIX hydrolase n=1 Tax=Pseudorhodoplanes sp. TaxID=1934341 RepID=UPI00391B4703
MKNKRKKERSRAIEAAGGIVVRGRVRPLFAIVQLRRQKIWVLPKGKLNRDESALAAARREAIEETGHDVEVHEFLGALAYKSGGRPKTVRFWRMQASSRPVAKLMNDVRAVRWLPLSQATAKLTHEREKAFLEKTGRQIQRQPVAARTARKGSVRKAQARPAPRSGKRSASGTGTKLEALRLKTGSGPGTTRPRARTANKVHPKSSTKAGAQTKAEAKSVGARPISAAQAKGASKGAFKGASVRRIETSRKQPRKPVARLRSRPALAHAGKPRRNALQKLWTILGR